MERDENCALVQGRPPPLYHPLSLVYHHPLIRTDHNVCPFMQPILISYVMK